MAISRKGKRAIVVDGAEYFWWVRSSKGSLTLHLVDSTGQLCLQYTSKDYTSGGDAWCHVAVIGPKFRSVSGCGGPHRRFRCPEFADSAAIYPKDVAELIRWSISERDDPVEVDETGSPICGSPGLYKRTSR